MPMKVSGLLFSAAPLLLAWMGGGQLPHPSPGASAHPDELSVELDKERLLEVEDLSESLANALLDFSEAVRDRDLSRIESYFQDEVWFSPWPVPAAQEMERVKWTARAQRELPESEARRAQRQEAVHAWKAYLDRFSEIEDARFKVQDAEFQNSSYPIRAESRIKFFLVGRDQEGKRFWVKGSGRLQALQQEEGWKLGRLTFQQVETLRAEVDLFSEISVPAGVAVSLPPYGSPGNDDFIYHGAGAGDLDGDGLVDLVVTGIAQTYVYLNQGDGTFREMAWDLGVPPNRNATAPLLLDYDNDGDLDLFFSAVGPQMLFENRLVPEGKLFFEDVSLPAGVALPAIGFSAVAGDVNGDGFPDIYVTSYNRYGRVMPNSWHRATNGTPNLLFVNQGDGTFQEAAETWKVADRRWSYAAQFADLDGDGRQDLYVANDFGENALYRNQGDHFEDVAATCGVLDPGNGMGVSLGDYNNDGVLDLYVTNMSSTAGNRILNRLFPQATFQDNVLRKLAAGNNLYRGDGTGSFTDVTASVGPFSAGWAWGGVFVDFDNDGWQDLYSTNGFISGKSMKDT